MVDRLEDLVPNFGGAAYRVRCFDHVTNLCAKSVIAPFDGGKAITFEGESNDDDTEVADDDGPVDNAEGWTDERTRMSEDERLALGETVEPVATVLVKVSDRRYRGQRTAECTPTSSGKSPPRPYIQRRSDCRIGSTS